MRKSVVLVFIAGIVSLVLVNSAIYKKEVLLKDGDVVYLELAPVDPRSLMQGDYMALRFAIGNQVQSLATHDGYVIVTLDVNGVGRYSRIDDQEPLSKNERRIRFRVRGDQVKFGTNAFFFQEGTAELYEDARYGAFRLDNLGELLLTGLNDKALNRLGENKGLE